MGSYQLIGEAGFQQQWAELKRRIGALERRVVIAQFTTAKRPAALDREGAIIYNETTNKHQGSDGTTWNDLY